MGIRRSPAGQEVAEKYQTHHTEIRISFDNLVNEVETILANYMGNHFSIVRQFPATM